MPRGVGRIRTRHCSGIPIIPGRPLIRWDSYGDRARFEEAREATRRGGSSSIPRLAALKRISLDQYASARTVRPLRRPTVAAAMVVADESALAHFNLGLAFRQKGYYSEALREYEEARSRRRGLEPGTGDGPAQGWARRGGRIRRPAGEGAGESQALERARRRTAPGWPVRRRRGELSCCAIRMLIRGYAIAHNNLGVALFHVSHSEQAVGAFCIALDLAPDIRAGPPQPGAPAFQGQTAAAEPRSVPPRAARRARTCSGLESGVVDGATPVRRSPTRVCPRRTVAGYAEADYNLSLALSNMVISMRHCGRPSGRWSSIPTTCPRSSNPGH